MAAEIGRARDVFPAPALLGIGAGTPPGKHNFYLAAFLVEQSFRAPGHPRHRMGHGPSHVMGLHWTPPAGLKPRGYEGNGDPPASCL